MGLVDYGSDSDSDSDPIAAPTAVPIASTSRSLLTSLHPPRASLNLPPPSTSTLSSSLPPPRVPAKKAKGPVRIVLDDLAPAADPSAVGEGEPPAKKPKFSLSGGPKGLSGLAAMLPAPKNEVVVKPAPVPVVKPVLSVPAGMEGLGDLGQSEEVVAKPKGMFVPYSMTKGKSAGRKVEPTPAAVAPEIDFFGLGEFRIACSPTTWC